MAYDKTQFGEDINIQEQTTKERLMAVYTKMAKEYGFESVEDFYVTTKFKLAIEGGKPNSPLVSLLNSIAADLGYGKSSKEFFMENTLPQMEGHKMIGA